MRLPGKLFENSSKSSINAFLSRITSSMSKIRATTTSFHGIYKGHYIPDSLNKSNFVFIRNNAHRTPLRRIYDGYRTSNMSHY